MSRKRGTQHRRRPRRPAHAGAVEDIGVGMVAAWCATEADLPEARQLSHDQLIELMGDRRTSGVQWRWKRGRIAGNDLIDKLVDPSDPPELANHYRRLRALLREHGGYIVVAMAEGRNP